MLQDGLYLERWTQRSLVLHHENSKTFFVESFLSLCEDVQLGDEAVNAVCHVKSTGICMKRGKNAVTFEHAGRSLFHLRHIFHKTSLEHHQVVVVGPTYHTSQTRTSL